jgi:hypothetical protein
LFQAVCLPPAQGLLDAVQSENYKGRKCSQK